MALAAIAFYRECPELWCAASSHSDVESRQVFALVSLAAFPTEPAADGASLVDLPCSMRNDAASENLSASAADVLQRLLHGGSEHPYLSWLPEGEQQELADLVAAGAVLRRNAFIDLLFSTRTSAQTNALMLLDRYTATPTAEGEPPLIKRATVDRLVSYGTAMNDEEIDDPWDRRCRHVAARSIVLALRGASIDRSSGERDVAGYVTQRIAELRASRAEGNTSSAVNAFLDAMDRQLAEQPK
jgi:hypothetical protein